MPPILWRMVLISVSSRFCSDIASWRRRLSMRRSPPGPFTRSPDNLDDLVESLRLAELPVCHGHAGRILRRIMQQAKPGQRPNEIIRNEEACLVSRSEWSLPGKSSTGRAASVDVQSVTQSPIRLETTPNICRRSQNKSAASSDRLSCSGAAEIHSVRSQEVLFRRRGCPWQSVERKIFFLAAGICGDARGAETGLLVA